MFAQMWKLHIFLYIYFVRSFTDFHLYLLRMKFVYLSNILIAPHNLLTTKSNKEQRTHWPTK